jgi:hypothetical protein
MKPVIDVHKAILVLTGFSTESIAVEFRSETTTQQPKTSMDVLPAIRKVATARIPSTFSFRGTGILSLRQVSRVFGFCHVDLLSILTMINS